MADSDADIQSEFLSNYKYAHDYWSPFIQDAQVYTLAASGYTWSEFERKELIKQGREQLEFNIMRRPLQFYSGYLRDNINQIIYGAVEGSDQATADMLTELGYYVWDKGNGYPTFLDACDEAFKSGISLCGLQMDYSKDFINGDISFFKRTYNSFYLDPTFENLDLKDCGFAITRDLITRDRAKQLMPFLDPKVIDEIQTGFRDDKFLSYHPQFSTFSRNKNLIAYDQYYRRTTRKRKYLVDLDNSFSRDISDLPADEMRKLREGVKKLQQDRSDADILDLDVNEMPNVEIKSIQRPYVELHIMLNGQHVWNGEDQTGIVEEYPFVPIICYMEPSIWMPSQRIQGMSACTYSLQRQFNKRHMKIIDMMDSTISTGYKYLIGSIADPADLLQAGQNKIIGVINDPEKAPQGLESVQQLNGGGANPALMEYQQILDQLSLTLGNVTEASLGMDEKRNSLVSGRLAQVQIAQNLMSNRKVFDQIDNSQQLLGGLVLNVMQNKFPPGKVKRILNKEPTEQFYDKQFEQFDAVIKEGVRSKSQKDAYYYELINLKRDGIVNVPESKIINALQMVGVDDLKEMVEQQEQQAAEQQKKVDAAEQVALEGANAKKEADLALAQVRRGREFGELGLMEYRAAEAQDKIADAALTRAKTITEIASLEDDRIMKVLAFVKSLENEERQVNDQIIRETAQLAQQINATTEGTSDNNAMQQQDQMQQQMQQQQQPQLQDQL